MRKLTLKQLGIGLLELMLSLAIISVLLVMATRYYQQARFNQQVNEAISLSQATIAASANWVIGESDYSDISLPKLVAEGYLPKSSLHDPWFGGVEVKPSSGGANGESDGSRVEITMQKVPTNACISVAKKINNPPDTRVTCKGSELTIIA